MKSLLVMLLSMKLAWAEHDVMPEVQLGAPAILNPDGTTGTNRPTDESSSKKADVMPEAVLGESSTLNPDGTFGAKATQETSKPYLAGSLYEAALTYWKAEEAAEEVTTPERKAKLQKALEEIREKFNQAFEQYKTISKSKLSAADALKRVTEKNHVMRIRAELSKKAAERQEKAGYREAANAFLRFADDSLGGGTTVFGNEEVKFKSQDQTVNGKFYKGGELVSKFRYHEALLNRESGANVRATSNRSDFWKPSKVGAKETGTLSQIKEKKLPVDKPATQVSSRTLTEPLAPEPTSAPQPKVEKKKEETKEQTKPPPLPTLETMLASLARTKLDNALSSLSKLKSPRELIKSRLAELAAERKDGLEHYAKTFKDRAQVEEEGRLATLGLEQFSKKQVDRVRKQIRQIAELAGSTPEIDKRMTAVIRKEERLDKEKNKAKAGFELIQENSLLSLDAMKAEMDAGAAWASSFGRGSIQDLAYREWLAKYYSAYSTYEQVTLDASGLPGAGETISEIRNPAYTRPHLKEGEILALLKKGQKVDWKNYFK